MNEKGQWTGAAEFTCVQGDFATNSIQSRLKIGTRITDLAANVPLELSFLALETFEATDDPGGWTTIAVTLKGYNESQWDFDNDRSKIYTRTTSLVEKSILENPNFIADISDTYVDYMRKLMDGDLIRRPDSTGNDFILCKNDNFYAPFAQFTDEAFAKWYAIIITKKNHTYMVPQTEWTVQTAGRLPLKASDMNGLGYIDDAPEGTPALPAGQNWMFSGVTENIQKQGDGVNSWSKTWTSSGPQKFDVEIYKKP